MKQIYPTNFTSALVTFSTVLFILLNGWSLYANMSGPALAEIFNLDRAFSESKYVQTSTIPSSIDEALSLNVFPNNFELVSGKIMEDGAKQGVFLASRSEGVVYEPAKYMVNHLNGGEVEEIFNYAFNNIFSFIVTKYKTSKGETEFSTTFSAYQNQDGTLNLESHWLANKYPTDHTFFNFQVWARNMKQLEVAVGDILKNVLIDRELNEVYSTKSPKVYLAKQIQHGRLLDLEIINERGIRNVQVPGKIAQNGQFFPKSIRLALSGTPTEKVRIPIEKGWTFDGQLNYTKSSIDKASLGDGSWGVYYGTEMGQVDQFNITQAKASYPVQGMLQSGLELTGSFTESVLITRTILGETMALDQLKSFNCRVKGIGALSVIFILDNGLDLAEQPRTDMMIDKETDLSIALDSFSNFENGNIKSIVFEVIPQESVDQSTWTFDALSFE